VQVIIEFPLIQFTRPDGRSVEINPMEVVSVRPIGRTSLILTTDGRFTAVAEECGEVKRRLEEP